MPKLIIPNAYELYNTSESILSSSELAARGFYNLRFLWLLEEGDIILLPHKSNKHFLVYLTRLKNITLSSVTIIAWEKKFGENMTQALLHPLLIQDLKLAMFSCNSWTLRTCYFNQTILELANNLNIRVQSTLRQLVTDGFIKKMNSKIGFRQTAKSLAIPIAEGHVCSSVNELAQAMKKLFTTSQQVLIKQDHNGGGRGNVGVVCGQKYCCKGAEHTIVLNKASGSIDMIASKIWHQYTSKLNRQLIAEIYYPSQGTFTAMYGLPENDKQPILLNYSEIRMEKTWLGVEIPGHRLSAVQVEQLTQYASKLAKNIQKKGYQGFICVDVILLHNGKLIFTEVNVRPGAETHAHILATHLYSTDYFKKKVILTRMGLEIDSFKAVYWLLKNNHLLLGPQSEQGIAILTVGKNYPLQCEYLIVASNVTRAYALEKQFIQLLEEHKSTLSTETFCHFG
ncbi:MAG: hypothetical protein JKY13_02990 [Gammaproteobacteria bacterium]|nr:hypothetical protein [Gammaproteobacteria bacterium]